VDVPTEFVSDFSQAVIRNLDNLDGADFDWASNAFFLLQYQNTKGETKHIPGDDVAEANAWNELTQDLLYDADEISEFYVDVAIETSIGDNTCVHWYRPHHAILYQAVVRVDRGVADHVVTRSVFEIDRVAHLCDVAGFRARTPDSIFNNWPNAPIFSQAYTTDKSTTQTPGGMTYAKSISATHVLDSLNHRGIIFSKLDAFYEQIMQIYHDCTEKHQPGSARVEARLVYNEARNWLAAGLPDEAIRGSIIVFRDDLLW
jgi:hypothetical protein